MSLAGHHSPRSWILLFQIFFSEHVARGTWNLLEHFRRCHKKWARCRLFCHLLCAFIYKNNNDKWWQREDLQGGRPTAKQTNTMSFDVRLCGTWKPHNRPQFAWIYCYILLRMNAFYLSSSLWLSRLLHSFIRFVAVRFAKFYVLTIYTPYGLWATRFMQINAIFNIH